MYVADLLLSDFRAVANARVEFVHPDQADAARLELGNINVLVGQNGGSKSTILKGIAAAVFADQIEDLTGGSVHEWPRYDSTGQCSVRAGVVEHFADRRPAEPGRLVTGVETTGNQRRVGLIIPRAPGPSLVVETSDQPAFADTSHPAGFLAAYGPTRRTEALGADEAISTAPRDRVVSLFDQAATLVPLEAWLPELDEERLNACVVTLQELLPPEVTFEATRADGEYQFVQRGVAVPRRALSDGMQSYLAWVSDLLYRLTQATEGGSPTELPGTVLVDEVDQRMHPRWQQTLLTTLSRGLPRLQFICAAHSPLVAGSLRPENLIVLEPDPNASGVGAMTATRFSEDVFGRTADQVLSSSYFGLESSRSDVFTQQLRALARAARGRDGDAALSFLRQLADPTDSPPVGRDPIQPHNRRRRRREP